MRRDPLRSLAGRRAGRFAALASSPLTPRSSAMTVSGTVKRSLLCSPPVRSRNLSRVLWGFEGLKVSVGFKALDSEHDLPVNCDAVLDEKMQLVLGRKLPWRLLGENDVTVK